MFALKPDGDSSGGGSGSSQLKTNLKFFGKLGLYFAAIRVAYVYFGAESGGESSSGGSAAAPSK